MGPLLPVGRSRRGPCNHHQHSRLYDSLKLCFLVVQWFSFHDETAVANVGSLYHRATTYNLELCLPTCQDSR